MESSAEAKADFA